MVKTVSRGVFLTTLAWLALCLPDLRADQRLEERPDSLASILGIDLAKEGLEELSGAAVSEFVLHTSADRSTLVWRLGDTLYLYPLSGGDHARLGAELLGALQRNGLVTFAAKREGGRLRQYTPARDVVAIRVRSVSRASTTP